MSCTRQFLEKNMVVSKKKFPAWNGSTLGIIESEEKIL